MTTSEQRFEPLHFGTSPAPARRSPAVGGAWYHLFLVLAAFAALAAWGFANPADGPVGDRFGPSTIASDQQLYDGHGKWGGYMGR